MPDKPRPMHPMIQDRVHELRHHATPPEQRRRPVLRGHRLGGLKFRRQEPIGPYIVDFCCRDLNLIVEVDGSSHEERLLSDTARTQWLSNEGYRVLRITNQDVMNDLQAVARYIAREAGIKYEG